MWVGTSLVLIAAGAILRYAVTAHVSWIDISTVGTILLVVGVIALILSIVYLVQLRSRPASRPRDVY